MSKRDFSQETFFAKHPKLKAAIDIVEPVLWEIEQLNCVFVIKQNAENAAIERVREATALAMKTHNVKEFDNLPEEVQKICNDRWVSDVKKFKDEVDEVRGELGKRLDILHEAFSKAENTILASAFIDWNRWSLYSGVNGGGAIDVEKIRKEVADVDLRIEGQRMRNVFRSLPLIVSPKDEIKTGDYIFTDKGYMYRVERVTPTGQVTMTEMHGERLQKKFTKRGWPKDARKISQEMMDEVLDLIVEYDKRHPEAPA